MKFKDIKINERILKSLDEQSINTLKEVQENTITKLLNNESLGIKSQTGSGKTLAYLIPLLNKVLISNKRFEINSLILAPTKELAIQIENVCKNVIKYTNIRTSLIIGGIDVNFQINKLKKKPDLIIATPARLIQLIKTKNISLENIETFVADEIDNLLDFGFKKDFEYILKNLGECQKIYTSATYNDYLTNLELVEIQSKNLEITNRIYKIDKNNKINLLKDIINELNDRVIIFTNTKETAYKLDLSMKKSKINSLVITSDDSVLKRSDVIKKFKYNKNNVLIATNLLSRGIDVKDLGYVINFEFSKSIDDFTHRCGRTARNNNKGEVISLVSKEEEYLLNRYLEINNYKSIIVKHKYKKENI